MPGAPSSLPSSLLTFAPLLHTKVWGGDALARWGQAVRPGDRIGEAWLLSDLAATSATGAGGGAAVSVVDRGPASGATLHDLVARDARSLLGAPGAAFPLLVKLLDAREHLSVQTHPSAAYAAAHADAHLKTESWFVLEAQPDAAIYAGLREGVDLADLPAAAREDRLAPLLRRVPVRAGDCVHLPSGTIHALGPGIVVAEVQTPSDTTFRVYDWGRTDRALHVDAAMACIDPALRPEPVRAPDGQAGRWPLVETDAYTIELLRADAPVTLDLAGRAWCVLCAGGSGALRAGDDRAALAPGGLVLAPARLGSVEIAPADAVSALLVRVGA